MFTEKFYASSNTNADILLAALTNGSAGFNQKTQDAVRAYLCEHLPPAALKMLSDELRDLPQTKDLYWTTFRLPSENLAHSGVWTAPLLAWGMNQPWAEDISFEALASNWASAQLRTNKKPETNYAIDLLHAVHYLAQSNNRLNDPALHEHLLEASVPFLKWQFMANCFGHQRRASVEVLGLSASLCGPSHKNTWLEGVNRTTDQHPGADYSVLTDILESDLPRDFKLAAAAATPKYWLNTKLLPHIQDCLPTEEQDRLPFIPWKDPAPNGQPASQSAVTDTARTNEQLMQAHCPVLHSVLASLGTPDDWSHSAWILEMGGACSASAGQPLDLPLEFSDATP